MSQPMVDDASGGCDGTSPSASSTVDGGAAGDDHIGGWMQRRARESLARLRSDGHQTRRLAAGEYRVDIVEHEHPDRGLRLDRLRS